MSVAILVVTKDALLALNSGEASLFAARHGSLGAIRGVVESAALVVFIGAPAAGRHDALAENEFKERLQGRNAGGDDDNVGLDAKRES